MPRHDVVVRVRETTPVRLRANHRKQVPQIDCVTTQSSPSPPLCLGCKWHAWKGETKKEKMARMIKE